MHVLSLLFLLHSAALLGHAFLLPPSLPVKTTVHVATKGDGEVARAAPSTSSLGMAANESIDVLGTEQERRSFLGDVARSIIFASTVAIIGPGGAAATPETSSLPKVTHKVYFDMRVSRADGTFYVKDKDPSDPSADEPLYGQLVLGLFGDARPAHAKQFLSYVDVPYQVDNPLPSYSRSKFPTLDAGSGLLIGGTIPGLEATSLAGGSVLEYSGRVIPAKLWLEDRKDEGASAPLPHNAKGLLTHRNLDLTPSFGITTRNQSTALDATHTVFGCILEDKSGFLEKVVDLPVLTDSGRVSRTTDEPVAVGGDVGGGSLASSVFTAQRAVFRDAAKTFGDSRLEKVYDGKLLRRIEVTKVGIL
ncbi:hypothetical protein ACHAXT_006146 [Thalassiosira profunda]